MYGRVRTQQQHRRLRSISRKREEEGEGGGASFPVINQQPFVFLLSSSFSAVVSDLAGDADILRTHEVFPAVFVWETSESACTFFVVE